MTTIDRVLHARLFSEQRVSRREQFVKHQAALAGHLGDARGVATQIIIALARVGPERVIYRLAADRQDEQNPRRFAVRTRILLHYFVEILTKSRSEFLYTCVAGE